MRAVRLIVLLLLIPAISSCDIPGQPALIAVVDLNVIAKALGRDEDITRNVQSANQEIQAELETIADDLQQLVNEEKTRLGDKPSAAEVQKFQQLVQTSNAQLNQSKQLAAQKSQEIQNTYINEFKTEVRKVVINIALHNGYSAVLTVSDALLWSDSAVDITDEIIAIMRDNEYEVNNKDADDTYDGA